MDHNTKKTTWVRPGVKGDQPQAPSPPTSSGQTQQACCFDLHCLLCIHCTALVHAGSETFPLLHITTCTYSKHSTMQLLVDLDCA